MRTDELMVVVDPRVRGTGLGRQIVGASERLATELGIRELYLLTETASDWFPRLGYRAVERAVDDNVLSVDWQSETHLLLMLNE